MDDSFLKYWYAGFDAALSEMDDVSRGALLKSCGRACADSYTRSIYAEEYEKAADMLDFISRLEKRFGEARFESTENGYILTYDRCLCDIAGKGFVKSPAFCQCSRHNILANWEAVAGEGNVDVNILSTILGGGDECRFSIKLKR